jgi:hypothetical protein
MKALINIFILLYPLNQTVKFDLPFPVFISLRSAILWNWPIPQTRLVASVAKPMAFTEGVVHAYVDQKSNALTSS